MRLRIFVLTMSILVFLHSTQALAERRVALVIGNAAYSIAPLKNPVNDARDMATTLKSLNFDVILKENASLAQMEGAVEEFWSKLRKGGSGLFYFAGHGLQVNGRNYLVPVDARLSVEQDAKYRCMDVGLVLGRMENAGNDLNIIILDACRNNPFARSWRSAEQGLAKMDAPKGSIIAYATAPDSVAADGEGRNGLYTEKLLRAMRTPGQPIEQTFKRVRDEVMKATKDKQVPWESTSLRGDFYFSPSAAGPAPAVQAIAPQPEQMQLAMAPVPQQTPGAGAPPQVPGAPGQTWRDPVTHMEFVWVPGGSFEMGCGSWTDNCDADEKPVHTVHLSGFWLGKYEVTQGQWYTVMRSNPSYFKNGDNFPVEQVSWNDAKVFISRLNGMGSARFRLPTEAEWEYAARSGGKKEKYAGGNDIDMVAWYHGNSGGFTQPVGTKAPNGLGLHDMSGNVWEWCEDTKDAYSPGPQENPVVTSGGMRRVDRGGAWDNQPGDVRVSYRSSYTPGTQGSRLGFRLVRIP